MNIIDLIEKEVKEKIDVYKTKKDYNDLSNRTKESFKEQYNLICKIVIGEDI